MIIFQLYQLNPGLIFPWIFAILIALTVHEFSHGFAAYNLGDDTAALSGRLSFNPLAHLDPVGTIMLLLVGFGYAKPVPINPYKIKKGNLGQFIVSFAGVFSNLILAIIFSFGLKILLAQGFDPANFLIKFFAFLVFINLALFIFNLIPIAPLDGYRILESIAPKAVYRISPFLEQWGLMIILLLVFVFPVAGYLISVFIYIFSLLFNLPITFLIFGG